VQETKETIHPLTNYEYKRKHEERDKKEHITSGVIVKGR